MEEPLLTRDEFREQVFARDKHTCVHCGQQGVDAHHIIERRLFSDGGYRISNGVTLCPICHVAAESTAISCETLRDNAGITEIILPLHFEPGVYDKWGNGVLPNGQRLQGMLFTESGVQKALRNHLYLFTDKVKYPKTFHWPSSPGLQNDDRMHMTTNQWEGLEIVVTEKLDGENTTMTRGYMHARSLEFSTHPSRTFIKAIWSRVAPEIPEATLNPERQEGLVFRPTRGFTLRQFPLLMAKWVRKGHVQTDEHWMSQPVKFNQLKK